MVLPVGETHLSGWQLFLRDERGTASLSQMAVQWQSDAVTRTKYKAWAEEDKDESLLQNLTREAYADAEREALRDEHALKAKEQPNGDSDDDDDEDSDQEFTSHDALRDAFDEIEAHDVKHSTGVPKFERILQMMFAGGQQVARSSKQRTDDNAPEEGNAPDAGSHALMRQDPKTYSSINPEVGTLPPPLACLLAH